MQSSFCSSGNRRCADCGFTGPAFVLPLSWPVWDSLATVSQKVGAESDPTNFLLMHAMGPNVAGVIGTAVAAGTFMAIFGVF